ncbi:MAG: transcriptional regulator [Deltaproteobacteria bacterium]|nr:MAG: transcriptional regulator [Deltaproteobacteria bacterium]
MVRGMNGSAGYAASFQRHFAAQLPKTILETIATEAEDDWSMEQIFEAAEAVGAMDALATTTLEEIARALLGVQAPAPQRPARAESVHARARATPKGVDPRRGRASSGERLSPEAAAELIVPIVAERGKATMLEIEEATKMGRRKVRFHVGRLVKAGRLVRHGMGRGTYYTVADED